MSREALRRCCATDGREGQLIIAPGGSTQEDSDGHQTSSRAVRTPAQVHLDPGGYLTNGRRLHRVLATLFNEGEALIELEDCATLDVWIVTSEEVASMRVVRVPR